MGWRGKLCSDCGAIEAFKKGGGARLAWGADYRGEGGGRAHSGAGDAAKIDISSISCLCKVSCHSVGLVLHNPFLRAGQLHADLS